MRPRANIFYGFRSAEKYPDKTPPEEYIADMDELLALMEAHGGRKPIWMTEFSYYAADDPPRTPFVPEPHAWADNRLLADERQGAEFTVRFLAVMLARGVAKVFLHSGASGAANFVHLECCLFRESEGTPRKLFAALAVFTDLVGPAPAFLGEALLGRKGRCAAFHNGAETLYVLWNPDRGSPITVTTAETAGRQRRRRRWCA